MIIMKPFLYSATVLLCTLNQNLCSAQPNNSSGDRCDIYGICGAFAICDSLYSPICSCLRGFDPVNMQEWSSGNWTSGCARRVPLADCEASDGTTNSSIQDRFYDLDKIIITGYTDRWPAHESECEGWCLRNCSCLAYMYIGWTGVCLFWCRDLIHIQSAPRRSVRLLIRVASSEVPVGAAQRQDSKTIIAVVASVVGIAVSICGGYLCWKLMIKRRGKRRSKRDQNQITLGSVDMSVQNVSGIFDMSDFPLFQKEVLAKATNNFSKDNKLGQGGFGPVYKGQLPNGRNIAIKRLSEASGQGLQEFTNEVELISKIQHRNLVRLLGFCVDNKDKMLIYEYMPNKSLDLHLFDPSNETLDWSKRMNVIEGICRGILYLHRDSRLKIIHRDLKPSNILLDDNWNPKISDFGMARIYETKQDHVSTIKVAGTRGYMAPEYAMGGRFSEKSDVFSFGVLVLEIATGRRNSGYLCGEDSWINLLGHVWKLWNEGKAATLIDSRISSPSNQEEVLRCIHIGLLCVQELPNDRPSISLVLSMLISETVELAEAKQPASSVRLCGSDTGASSSKQDQKTSSSVNDVTLTMLDAR